MANRSCKSALKSPQPVFPVSPFISQAEILDVLRLRSQYGLLKFELETAENSVLKKLEGGARIEAGPYACGETNTHLVVWEDEDFRGVEWRREKREGVLA